MDLRDPAIQGFVMTHENEDVAKLGLAPMPPDWPRTAILNQIKSRQKAKTKIPAWLGIEGIIFPSPSLLEQCSSQATANFKASLFAGESFADLTAGAGVDSAALAQKFKYGFAIERDKEAAQLLSNNLPLLSPHKIEILNKVAEEVIADLPTLDLIYIDPQRRSENKRGLFKLEETSPNVLALLPKLRSKAKNILIKASPVLDIALATQQLGAVKAVYVVSLHGECKELLFHLSTVIPAPTSQSDGGNERGSIPAWTPARGGCDTEIIAAILNNNGTPAYTLSKASAAPAPISAPQTYLYEPDAAIMKAGLFNELAAEFDLAKLHPATHLFTSGKKHTGFPGRSFTIKGILPPDKKELQRKKIEKANVTVRNFPATVDELRKKLNLKEGGDDYLFACTLLDARKALICCARDE